MIKNKLISDVDFNCSKLKKNFKKRNLGQFFTTNCDYILQGLEQFVKNKEITDPFAGNQDLLNWAKKNNCKNAIGFDCDKNCVDNQNVFFNDSLNSLKKYQFIFTNPPYLHKNKASKELKEIFFKNDNSQFEDLYQIALKSCFDCDEGIIIIPLNFLCAQNSSKIRELFFTKFSIIKIFNEKLNENRQKYFSFFLTNFRDNDRKRISFETAYKLINLIYEENTKIPLQKDTKKCHKAISRKKYFKQSRAQF